MAKNDETVTPLVVPAAKVSGPLKAWKTLKGKTAEVYDDLAALFRTDVYPAADEDYGKGWTALTSAIRSFLKKGLAEDDKDALAAAESDARTIIQNVRNRVRDLMPERAGSATDNAANTIRMNTKKGALRDLFNGVVTTLNAVVARMDTEEHDFTQKDANRLSGFALALESAVNEKKEAKATAKAAK